MNERVLVPRHHLVVTKADCQTIPALTAMLKSFEPDLPETFISTMTIVLGGGRPNVTGLHVNATAESVASRIHSLFYDPDIQAISQGQTDNLSILIFYSPEETALMCYVTAGLEMRPLEKGTFPSLKEGHVG